MNHVAGRLAAGTHELGGETQVSIQADPAGPGPELPRQATVQQASGNGSSAEYGVSFKTVDLTLSFGTRAVLSDIDTDFQRSRITALLGPTGSGKSTLLRTFNRMNDKVTGYRHDGDVILEGNSIFGSGVELMSLRRRVGMVFQRPNPFPMSIFDNVVAGARAHKLASKSGLKDIAENRLKEVGLWGAVSSRLKDSPFT